MRLMLDDLCDWTRHEQEASMAHQSRLVALTLSTADLDRILEWFVASKH
jgi:hypothetical protein